MIQNRRRIHLFYLLVDIVLISLSFYLPYQINHSLVPPSLLGFRSYFLVFVFWGISVILLLNNFSLYSTDRFLSVAKEWWLVVRCVLSSAILTSVFIFVLKIDVFSRLIFIEITLLLLISLSLWRAIKRTTIRYLILRGHFNWNVLIVGAGKMGAMLAEEIQNNAYSGLRIIGFLDDAVEINQVNGFKILGKIKDLEEVVKSHFVDQIFVTIPSERKVASDVIVKGIRLSKTVRIVAENFDLPYKQLTFGYIGFIPLITYFEKGLYETEELLKRSLDIIVCGLSLILLFPLFVIIAFLIKIDSRGPIFYISPRCGKKGKVFNFYKFRSMVDNADKYKDALRTKSQSKGPIFKIRDDPRTTIIGRILRKYSLDELPQLFNVLIGDMSLVGPRPFPVDESEKIENKYILRLNIRPGITGLAQVRGRSDLPYSHWVRWDVWYVNNWSLGLDLKILWWTIPAVLKAKGAY